MLKKILIMSMLLISGLNAENSLAEEAALKKQQEQQKDINKKNQEEEYKTVVISHIKKIISTDKLFFEKYLIKDSDTPEMIDNKYKNKIQLYEDMMRDYILSINEQEDFRKLVGNKYDYDVMQKIEYRINQEKVFAIIINNYFYQPIYNRMPIEYIDGYDSEDRDKRVSAREAFLQFNRLMDRERQGANPGQYKDSYDEEIQSYKKDAQNAYINYLKLCYETYDERQKKAQKQQQKAIQEAQAQKQQQLSLANEKKERQRVQGACQAWRTKANRMVYSLGAGDKVMSRNGGVYIIQGTNANTFLVNSLGYNLYLQKSECIPYSSLSTSPSQYCYQ